MKQTHHTQMVKQNQMRHILASVYVAKEVFLDQLKEECFDKIGLSPKTTMRYLRELEELNKVKIELENNKVIATKFEEEK